MSTYTKEQFLQDVAAEAKALREHATKKELARLDFKSLDPDFQYECIYGQMTGNCKSVRATKLIGGCCIRYFNNSVEVDAPIENGFGSVQKRVNDRTADNLESVRPNLKYLSTIEVYIILPDAQNANLIAYLRGEREDLVL